MDAKTILLNYYSNLKTASTNPIYKEAYDIIALSPTSFFSDLAKKIGVGLFDIIKLFKDSRVVKFFNFIKWNFKQFYETLEQGFKNTVDLQKILETYVKNNRITKFTSENIKQLIDFLEQHPLVKKIAGYGIAALIIYLWFIGFKQINLNTVIGALRGGTSVSKLFAGPQGAVILKILALTGLSIVFPWAGMALKVKFALDLVGRLANEIGVRLKKSSSSVKINFCKIAKFVNSNNLRRH